MYARTNTAHGFLADTREPAPKKQRASQKSPEELRAEIRALARGEDVPSESAASGGGGGGKNPKGSARPAAHSVESADLLKDYLRHRRANGESTSVDEAALRARLARTREQIKAKYKVRDVRFKVVTENGRSKLKALPVK